MDLIADERLSDSPLVQTVWRSYAEHGASFSSMANSSCDIVITKIDGHTVVTGRGLATQASAACCPPNAEFFGIQSKPGALMPDFPAGPMMDRSDVNLPE